MTRLFNLVFVIGGSGYMNNSNKDEHKETPNAVKTESIIEEVKKKRHKRHN